MARDGPAIGIDLGTTYCCVGVHRNGRVEIIPNAQGERTTPSVVSFTNAAECLVGEPARNHFLRNPSNTIFDAKRLIGRKFSDPIVQNDMKLWPFTVVAGSGDKPMITVQHNNEEKQFSAEDISSIVLTNLRETAESYIGSKIKNAVVTVPAYFNNAQRQETKEAGRKAGLHVMRVINEPTAAALAYGLDQRVSGREGKKNILIFDLGGGTFDVSLLSVDAGDLKVIAIAGDSHLGGEDFDSRLVNYCLEEFERRHKKDVRSNCRALRRLRTACERAKRILSFQVDTAIDIDSFFDGIDLQMAISVARFDELNMDLFQRCMELVDQCLKDASLSTSLVEEVVLVGGSTRILKIQELLQEFFPNSNMCRRINPDEAVACGAATYAAMLGGESSMRINDIVVQDVTPLSLGLGIAGGLMSILIPKNSTIPVKKEKCFTTSFDNQSVIKFTVYEGEKTLARDNNLLGDFELSGLPPGPKLSLKIPVTFEINVDGILVVSAENPITKRKSELTIARESGWLSNETTDGNMVGGAEKRRREEARKRDESKTRLENYASDLKSMLNSKEMEKKLKRDQRRALMDEIGKALAWVRLDQYASSAAIESRMMELEKTCSRAFSESAAGSRKWRSCFFWRK